MPRNVEKNSIPTAGRSNRWAASKHLEARISPLWIFLLLAAVTFGLYAKTVVNGFINYDDDQYVYNNFHVFSGVNLPNLRWAFQTGHAANWHPLAWLSHMLDCQLFGLTPGFHHLTSTLLHSFNAGLLFLALTRLTGSFWCSAIVGAIFALHPTRVESVAWISERKDVLSTFFWLLTIIAYERYVLRPSWRQYGTVASLFTLGLMSKPMVVTLPFVLLLLDYWPLDRLRSPAEFQRRVVEKLPLFALSMIACVITLLVQQTGGAVVPIASASLESRLANAAIGYFFYLAKLLWPSSLFIPYWYDWRISLLTLLGLSLALAGLTFVAVSFAKRRPYLAVGWFWYLGTLVPVIGLVQVGAQSAADRYIYVPAIGIFVIIVWSAADFLKERGLPRWMRVVLPVGAVFVCMLLTFRQISHWKDGVSLFQHTLRSDPPNLLAMKLLAWSYATDLDPKVRNGEKAVELASLVCKIMNRADALALRALAAGYAEMGKFPEAIATGEEAIESPHAKAQPQLTALLRTDLEQYRKGQPVYEGIQIERFPHGSEKGR